jgi:hypothetical protein
MGTREFDHITNPLGEWHRGITRVIGNCSLIVSVSDLVWSSVIHHGTIVTKC